MEVTTYLSGDSLYFPIGSFGKADYSVTSGIEGISLNFVLKLFIYFLQFSHLSHGPNVTKQADVVRYFSCGVKCMFIEGINIMTGFMAFNWLNSNGRHFAR